MPLTDEEFAERVAYFKELRRQRRLKILGGILISFSIFLLIYYGVI